MIVWTGLPAVCRTANYHESRRRRAFHAPASVIVCDHDRQPLPASFFERESGCVFRRRYCLQLVTKRAIVGESLKVQQKDGDGASAEGNRKSSDQFRRLWQLARCFRRVFLTNP